jgi:hypothetical protein
MWTTVKRYYARIKHRPVFLIALVFIFGLGVSLVIVAKCVYRSDGEPWQGLFAGFGDALIIAAVIALLVDPVAQQQFAQEWGHDLYWAIFSPHAPQTFRHALENLAAPDAYIDKCTHVFTINRGDGGVVHIEWHISIYGHALKREQKLVWDGRVFVVRRHDGSPATYKYWSFQVEGEDKVEFDGEQLKNLKAIDEKSSGRCVLDQSKLPDVQPVPFGKQFWSERRVDTTLRATDYLTIFQPKIVLKQQIIVKGDVVSKFNFYVTQLGGDIGEGGEQKLEFRKLAGGSSYQRCDLDEVAFPGQTTLLFWREKS